MVRALPTNCKSPLYCSLFGFTSQVILVGLLVEISLIFQVSSADYVSSHRSDELIPRSKYKYGHQPRNVEGSYNKNRVADENYYTKLHDAGSQNANVPFSDHAKIVHARNSDLASDGAKHDNINAGQQFGRANASSSTNSEKISKIDDTTSGNTNSTRLQSEIIDLHSGRTNEILNSSLRFVSPYLLSNNENVIATFGQESDVISDAQNTPIMLERVVADETHLHPELNDISSGLVRQIVSILPKLFAPARLSRPIIVSEDVTNFSRKTDSFNSTGKQADEVVGSRTIEYGMIEDESKYDEEAHHKSPVETDNKSESSVEISFEPQLVEEQAVITTTLDITKSLPLAVNIVSDVNNHIHESAAMPPQPLIVLHSPAVQFAEDRHPMVILPPPTTILHNSYLPYLGFQYVPIPALHHHPNMIPLNFINVARNENWASEGVPKMLNTFVEKPFKDRQIFQKHVKHRSVMDQPPVQQQQQQQQLNYKRGAPSHITFPPVHIIPYTRLQKNDPQPHIYYQVKHQMDEYVSNVPPHQTPHNIKSSDKQFAGKSNAPFRPSHPVWDSVYPPSHMYYAPYYMYDKIPNDRKSRDSWPDKRKQRYLRRLFVEYGGFKPPMIPSTLIETSEGNTERKQAVKGVDHN